MKKLILLSAGAAAFGLAACGSGGGGGGDTPAVLGQVQFGEMDSTDLKWALDVSGGATYSFASKRTLDAAIPQTYLPIDQLNLNSKPAGAKDFIQLPISADSTAHATLTAGAGGNTLQLKLFVRLGNATSDTTYTYYFKSYNATTNPYGVYGPADLSYVRNALGASYQQRKNIVFNVGDATAKLGIADYDASGWLPIGVDDDSFTGSYNGGGFTIDQLHLSRPSTDNQGLFGYTSGSASITKLGLTNLDVKGKNNTGGLVGWQNSGSIAQAYATGTVSASEGAVGGLVGWQNSGSISQSYATGAVSSASGGYVGGLVGGQNSGSISQAYATGAVSSSGNSVGGLVGGQYGSISQAYATGAVSSTSGNYLGGLVGWQNSGSISQAYATGAVSTSGNYLGGLVGYQGGSISQAYATGLVTDSSAAVHTVGGLVGTKYSGNLANVYYKNVYYKKQGTYTGVGSDATGGIADANSGAIAVTTGTTDSSFAGFIWTDATADATPANNIWTRTGAVSGGAKGSWPVFGGAWLSTGWGDTNTQTLQPLP